MHKLIEILLSLGAVVLSEVRTEFSRLHWHFLGMLNVCLETIVKSFLVAACSYAVEVRFVDNLESL